MRPFLCRLAAVTVAVMALAGCDLQEGVGYIEVRTSPASLAAHPAIYLDSVKLEPLRKGAAVLSQKVGTRKLQADGSGGQLALLCDVVVKKNRITTVTVSILERPPRCQCRSRRDTEAASSRICVS